MALGGTLAPPRRPVLAQTAVAHLGIWSRQDPWAPAVLEPLIVGLKQKGFCFATLREHPQFAAHVRQTAQGHESTALARASGVP